MGRQSDGKGPPQQIDEDAEETEETPVFCERAESRKSTGHSQVTSNTNTSGRSASSPNSGAELPDSSNSSVSPQHQSKNNNTMMGAVSRAMSQKDTDWMDMPPWDEGGVFESEHDTQNADNDSDDGEKTRASACNSLDDVITKELHAEGEDEGEDEDADSGHADKDCDLNRNSHHSEEERTGEERAGRVSELVGRRSQDHKHEILFAHFGQGKKQLYHRITSIIENRWWSAFFMLLTFYALFTTDVDLLVGNKESKFVLSVVTSGVFFLFLFELAMQSAGKPGYPCRAYFWLDLVAVVSLLPDTWLVQNLVYGDDSAFAAGRSSKIARIVRVASRSSKATRLNRLTRIVRIATLMPRLAAIFGKQVKDEESHKIMNRKLQHIFAFLDEDMDGNITREALDRCLAKLRVDKKSKKKERKDSSWSKGESSVTSSAHGEDQISRSVTSARSFAVSEWDQANQLVDFSEFKQVILDDERIKSRLLATCRQQVKSANNMQNIASRHSEDVGVKVAVGVLLMLLVLGVLEPTVDDNSSHLGLEYITKHVSAKPHVWSNGTWSRDLRQHVKVWLDQVSQAPTGNVHLLYMDINNKVFCNEFALGEPRGQRCDTPLDVTPFKWMPRGHVKDIDEDLFASDYRLGDLTLIQVFDDPNLDLDDVPDEEVNNRTLTTAALYSREKVEAGAQSSIITTVFVIFIILAGIILLTKDLNFLSLSLLRPLRSLAEEMQSIVQLQIAALTMDAAISERSCAEIRMIQRIFNNMKKAIKSWGKYVPWPVVQILLNAGVDAKPGVRTREVTIFFSDIAGFTTIVEHLPPEQSLLLLSRYFNDMSKVIDDHQGIVIEFIGDAILSVFGAPLKNPDHATSCVKASLGMLACLEKINAWAVARGLPEISIRCGVHTGRVLVGNMGFHSRMKYGVVGHNANIPDRLEELNKTYGTNLLISHATYSKIPSEAFVVRPIDYMYLNKRAEPIYHVMAKERSGTVKHKLTPVASLHRRALKRYREGQFKQAMAIFADVNEKMKELQHVEEDSPSILMIKRCETYLQRPPPPNWDGVWGEPS